MTDIANLGYSVDTSQVAKGTTEIDKHADAVARLERRIQNLQNKSHSSTLADSLRKELDALKGVKTASEEVEDQSKKTAEAQVALGKAANDNVAVFNRASTAVKGFFLGFVAGSALQLATRGMDLLLKVTQDYIYELISNQPTIERGLKAHAELVKEIKENWDGASESAAKYSGHTRESFRYEAQGNVSRLENVVRLAVEESIGDPIFKARFLEPGVGANEPRLQHLLVDFLEQARAGTLDTEDVARARSEAAKVGADPRFRAQVEEFNRLIDEMFKPIRDLDQARDLLKGVEGDQKALNDAIGKTGKTSAQTALELQQARDALERLGGAAAAIGNSRAEIFGRPFPLKPPGATPGGLSAAPPDLQNMIRAAGTQYDIPPGLLTALLRRESNFDPKAVGTSGEYGIAQFMPETAAQYGVDRSSVQSSVFGAARYLQDLKNQFGGDLTAAVAAYNAGPGRVSAYRAGTGTLPESTKTYVSDIFGEFNTATGQQPSGIAATVNAENKRAQIEAERAAAKALADEQKLIMEEQNRQIDASTAAYERQLEVVQELRQSALSFVSDLVSAMEDGKITTEEWGQAFKNLGMSMVQNMTQRLAGGLFDQFIGGPLMQGAGNPNKMQAGSGMFDFLGAGGQYNA